MTTARHHAALPLLLGAPAAAQAPSRDAPPQPSQPGFSAPMVVLLVALIAGFLFIGFFSVYMRRCGRAASPGGGTVIPAAALLALARHEQRSQRQRGLDPAVVAAFPTMRYAEAKELRVGGKDAALECAVCLSEFEDDEELRLLPACSHAFHTDCIGEWLAGHVTCPVCRCNLDPEAEELAGAEDEAAGSGEEVGSSAGTGDAEEQRDQVAVDIDVSRGGAEEEERRREAAELERIGTQRRAVRSQSARVVPRSHSTGHSLAAPRVDGDGADLERFTLRLPEHVRREMLVAAVAAGEESLRRTGPEPGPRGGNSNGGSRSARSDRWPSLIARTLSSRVPFWSASTRRAPDAAAVAAAAGGTTATTERSSKREKTGSAASDGSLTPPKGSVRFDCLGAPAVSGARVGAAAGDSETEDDEEEKAIARHRPA